MLTELNQKNKFVLASREHLKSLYGTKCHYTYGEGDFEGQKVGNAYCLVRRNSNKPKDISGFSFRKDLCSWTPQNATDVLRNVHDFASRDENLESVLGREGKNMKIKFGDREYLVTSHIDSGYAGEINITFMELPHF